MNRFQRELEQVSLELVELAGVGELIEAALDGGGPELQRAAAMAGLLIKRRGIALSDTIDRVVSASTETPREPPPGVVLPHRAA